MTEYGDVWTKILVEDFNIYPENTEIVLVGLDVYEEINAMRETLERCGLSMNMPERFVVQNGVEGIIVVKQNGIS